MERTFEWMYGDHGDCVIVAEVDGAECFVESVTSEDGVDLTEELRDEATRDVEEYINEELRAADEAAYDAHVDAQIMRAHGG